MDVMVPGLTEQKKDVGKDYDTMQKIKRREANGINMINAR